MIVYSVRYNLKTPLLISKPTIGNVIRNEYSYLPGSVIRGAILKELWLDGYKDKIKEEMVKPSIIFHPAFPIFEDKIYKPAHALIYKCKICKKNKYIEKDPYTINSIEDLEIERFCNNGHPYTLKSIGGKLFNESLLKECKLSYTILTSVGINRIVKGSEAGLLYSYIALEPNNSFEGLIVVDDNRYNIDKINTVFLGKGSSRGFGEVELKIKEVDYYKIREDKLNDIINKSNTNKLVLKAITPLFNITYSENGLINDNNFDLDRFGLKYNFSLVSSTSTISGFSIYSNIPKISLTGIKEGSLLYAHKTASTNIDKLVEMELKGIGPFASNGFNIVEVI
ncbi:MAG: hypothetical protein KatS3mg003_2039 [Candidatus Nitrosocaldaceae archaeon]|nr:MAG: hypothetical protein KatS3mg003_2039 [Candidatus Nitrosocaldaceae archaeon]